MLSFVSMDRRKCCSHRKNESVKRKRCGGTVKPLVVLVLFRFIWQLVVCDVDVIRPSHFFRRLH